MIYNYAEAGDRKFLVTGAENAPLYGLNGFTEAQAREIAFHLNVAFDRGVETNRSKVKEALRRSEYARHAALCNLNQFYDTAEGLKSACVCSCGLDD